MNKKDPIRKDPKKKSKGDLLRKIMMGVALAVFLFSGGMLLVQTVILPAQNRGTINKYQDLFQNGASSSTTASTGTTSSPGPVTSQTETTSSTGSASSGEEERFPTEILDKFRPVLEANDDIGGWLIMPDTELNHPVFYTPEHWDYYLTRDADGNYNKYGSLFLSRTSTLAPQAQVMVMYGHNMEQDDLMFGQLNKYKKLSFLQTHPTFTFDTLYQEGTWKIIGVCRASTGEMNRFNYDTTDYPTEEAFDAFIKEMRKRSMYRIEDDVTAEDSLLVMSTCDYVFFGDRLLVVARRLRADETAESVNTGNYQVNEVMLWPEVYYGLSYVNATRPTDEQIEQGYLDYYGE